MQSKGKNKLLKNITHANILKCRQLYVMRETDPCKPFDRS